MITPINGLENTIDRLHRSEAERMLISPHERDIDAFLFMYNRVVELEAVINKLNEVIDELNKAVN